MKQKIKDKHMKFKLQTNKWSAPASGAVFRALAENRGILEHTCDLKFPPCCTKRGTRGLVPQRPGRACSPNFTVRTTQILKHVAVLTVVIWVVSTLGLAKAANVTATLEPADISMGQAAQLTVTVQSRDADEPQIPAVNGLDFQQVGQSSQIQVINGAMSANVSYTYAVTAVQPGSFTIPAIQAGSGATAAMSQPVMLKVRKGSAGSAPTLNYPNQNSLPAPSVNGDEEQMSSAEQQSFGFLRLVAPKKEFYVGEMVPVELKACFRAGVELRVDGLPRLNSDAFTMNKLGDQPARSQQLINGVPYTVFIWSTAITAVKAGDYAMSVEIPTTVTARQRAPRPSMGSPFDDDFFDQAFNNFFGSATQKQIALNSSPATGVKILSLPVENQPASFTGAVGQFDIAAEISPARKLPPAIESDARAQDPAARVISTA